MKSNFKKLLGELELQETLEDLKSLGLNREEIEGFIDFYYHSWIDVLEPKEDSGEKN